MMNEKLEPLWFVSAETLGVKGGEEGQLFMLCKKSIMSYVDDGTLTEQQAVEIMRGRSY